MKTTAKIILLLFFLLFAFSACEQTDIDTLKVEENEQGLTERRITLGNGGGTLSLEPDCFEEAASDGTGFSYPYGIQVVQSGSNQLTFIYKDNPNDAETPDSIVWTLVSYDIFTGNSFIWNYPPSVDCELLHIEAYEDGELINWGHLYFTPVGQTSQTGIYDNGDGTFTMESSLLSPPIELCNNSDAELIDCGDGGSVTFVYIM